MAAARHLFDRLGELGLDRECDDGEDEEEEVEEEEEEGEGEVEGGRSVAEEKGVTMLPVFKDSVGMLRGRCVRLLCSC